MFFTQQTCKKLLIIRELNDKLLFVGADALLSYRLALWIRAQVMAHYVCRTHFILDI